MERTPNSKPPKYKRYIPVSEAPKLEDFMQPLAREPRVASMPITPEQIKNVCRDGFDGGEETPVLPSIRRRKRKNVDWNTEMGELEVTDKTSSECEAKGSSRLPGTSPSKQDSGANKLTNRTAGESATGGDQVLEVGPFISPDECFTRQDRDRQPPGACGARLELRPRISINKSPRTKRPGISFMYSSQRLKHLTGDEGCNSFDLRCLNWMLSRSPGHADHMGSDDFEVGDGLDVTFDPPPSNYVESPMRF